MNPTHTLYKSVCRGNRKCVFLKSQAVFKAVCKGSSVFFKHKGKRKNKCIVAMSLACVCVCVRSKGLHFDKHTHYIKKVL